MLSKIIYDILGFKDLRRQHTFYTARYSAKMMQEVSLPFPYPHRVLAQISIARGLLSAHPYHENVIGGALLVYLWLLLSYVHYTLHLIENKASIFTPHLKTIWLGFEEEIIHDYFVDSILISLLYFAILSVRESEPVLM